MKAGNFMLKTGLTLLLICAVAGCLLGVAHTVTAGPIEAKKQKVDEEAYGAVLESSGQFEEMTVEEGFEDISVLLKADTGYIFKVTGKGYAGGDIEMVVGIDQTGSISGLQILSHEETPGLGARATDASFTGQYVGHSAQEDLVVLKNGAEAENGIDALTGATKTSNGVTAAVNRVLLYYRTYLEGGV